MAAAPATVSLRPGPWPKSHHDGRDRLATVTSIAASGPRLQVQVRLRRHRRRYLRTRCADSECGTAAGLESRIAVAQAGLFLGPCSLQ